MGWLKKVWRKMFKDPPPVVPGGYDLHAEIEKRRIEEGKKLDAMLHDGWWKQTAPEPHLFTSQCPLCDRTLTSLPNKPEILMCVPCDKAYIPPEVWEDPNFQRDITQRGCDTSKVTTLDGSPTPAQLDEEYDIDDVCGRLIAASDANEHCVDKTIPELGTADVLDVRDRRLANEIDEARSFGQAYIEEKHGMPFSQWVSERKKKREGDEECST